MDGNSKEEVQRIKCVVWDLDDTVWTGILLENDQVSLNEDVIEIIKTLDGRGILHSIASKNEYDEAISKLKELKIEQYFLHPQISWNSKSASILQIAKSLNISTDAIAFIDDQPYELEEVKHSIPDILLIRVTDIHQIIDWPEFNPSDITDEAKNRRIMYLSDIQRSNSESEFLGPKEDFLATLQMNFTISKAREEDLRRAEELTIRTHQLNSTGYTYSYEELDKFRQSDNHSLLIAQLDDRFGSYGHIGLSLLEYADDVWNLKMLLMSCRVMSRGVGSIFLTHIINQARDKNVRLVAEFVPTDRNRIMRVTFMVAGFKESLQKENLTIFEHDFKNVQKFPMYVKLKIV